MALDPLAVEAPPEERAPEPGRELPVREGALQPRGVRGVVGPVSPRAMPEQKPGRSKQDYSTPRPFLDFEGDTYEIEEPEEPINGGGEESK